MAYYGLGGVSDECHVGVLGLGGVSNEYRTIHAHLSHSSLSDVRLAYYGLGGESDEYHTVFTHTCHTAHSLRLGWHTMVSEERVTSIIRYSRTLVTQPTL